MGAGSAMPGVRYVVIYLASPSEVHKAFEINGGHPAIQAMRTVLAVLSTPQMIGRRSRPSSASWLRRRF